MADLVRTLELTGPDRQERLGRRWLVTNGLGGFASGLLSGILRSRYHGLLVAALGAPLGRVVMLTHLLEHLQRGDGAVHTIGGGDLRDPETVEADGLVEFRLENGLPVWRYALEESEVERRVLLPQTQNTVQVQYRMLSGPGPLRVTLQPSLHFRPLEARVSEALRGEYALSIIGNRFEVANATEVPPLRLRVLGDRLRFTAAVDAVWEVFYRAEAERGYDSRGALWTPGSFSVDLAPGCDATLVASTEPWDVMDALSPTQARDAATLRRRRLRGAADPAARGGVAGELVLAADQFVIIPVGRRQDLARSRAAGDEVRTVIAGYHWFTDWGRDTMICLEGLTLCTGRFLEAGWILKSFAHYVRDGLIPNLFPEGGREGLYHTADATLWFFHALDRYLQATKDRVTLEVILPRLVEIVDRHLAGTRFGIRADADGLLTQGAPGYQLTWMDAKVEDWVVTPRRGKAVEINALWYNALRKLERWMEEERGAGQGRPYGEQAARVREAFNRRFWYAEGGYCYDVVDGEQGDDASLRPNQLLAISLPDPVLEEGHWAPVLDVCRARLLTPFGLRSLAPGHPDYKPKYFGDLRARDAAYHQGTVWAWLIGPFIDAYLRVHPEDRAGARRLLDAFGPQLDEHGVGSLSEIFDAEPPFTARGCIAQGWSVAEVLRCLVKTAPAETPTDHPVRRDPSLAG